MLDCASNKLLRVLELPIGIACHGVTPPTHGGSFGTLGIAFCRNWGQFGTFGGIFKACPPASLEQFIDHEFDVGGSHTNWSCYKSGAHFT